MSGGDREVFEDELRRLIREIVAPERWLACSEHDHAAVRVAGFLKGAGVTNVLAVGAYGLMGPVDPSVELLSIGLPPAATTMEEIRSAGIALASPPASIQASIDDWDPGRRAVSVGSFTTVAESLGGRRTFGARRPEWAALEDKLAIVDVWRSAGIAIPPSEEVDLRTITPTKARSVHDRLHSAGGTVWAADNSKGFHGAASGLRWVSDEAEVDEVVAELAVDHQRARVTAFLDGIPCSIHGMVLRDRTLAFRPCEMVVYRSTDPTTGRRRFLYARAATFWDPAAEDTKAMRSMAVAVGDELRQRVDFRGVFTLDGVLTAEGFRPTETNTRYGAALPTEVATQDPEAPSISLFLLHVAAAEGRLDHLDETYASQLERWVIDRLDEVRRGSIGIATISAPDVERSATLVDVPGAIELTAESSGEPEGVDARSLAAVTWGQGNGRLGYLRLILDSTSTPIGPSVAEHVLSLLDVVEQTWHVGLPVLEPAPDLRA